MFRLAGPTFFGMVAPPHNVFLTTRPVEALLYITQRLCNTKVTSGPVHVSVSLFLSLSLFGATYWYITLGSSLVSV